MNSSTFDDTLTTSEQTSKLKVQVQIRYIKSNNTSTKKSKTKSLMFTQQNKVKWSLRFHCGENTAVDEKLESIARVGGQVVVVVVRELFLS